MDTFAARQFDNHQQCTSTDYFIYNRYTLSDEQTDRQTDSLTNRWTDGDRRRDERTDGQTDRPTIPLADILLLSATRVNSVAVRNSNPQPLYNFIFFKHTMPTPWHLPTLFAHPQSYLMKFGYLPESDLETGALRTDEELQRAVRHFQRFAHLPQTGRFDAETVDAMRRPRCGMADLLHDGSGPSTVERHGRSTSFGTESAAGFATHPERYTYGPSKWHKNKLTFRYRMSLHFLYRVRSFYPRTCVYRVYVDDVIND